MEPTLTARLYVELDLEITDPEEVQAHARDFALRNSGGSAAALADMLAQAEEGVESALMLAVEASDVVDEIPGVTAVSATMWMDPIQMDDGDDGGFGGDAGDGVDGVDILADDDSMDAGEDDGQWSEDDWLEKFRVDAAKLPGLPLAMFGLDPRDSPADPADPAQPQRHAVLLAGAVHWAYENLIDELFDDIALLRQDPSALGETLQLAQLPEQHRDSVDPLFAQRFLAAALDLGTALATDYTGPSCPAQAQALMLILGGVDLVPRLLPSIPLPHGWRDALALDAAQADNHDVSDWFIPFPGHTLNPYAADAE